MRRYTGDDTPYDIHDAADICFGTCASSIIYQSRLRNIINNETLFQTIGEIRLPHTHSMPL